MKLKFDFTAMTDNVIGGQGVSASDLAKDRGFIKGAFDKTINDNAAWRELPFDEKLTDEVESFCAPIRKKAEAVVVFGIGGSALGIKAAGWSLLHLNHNSLKKHRRGAPKIYVDDNVDPERLTALLEVINIKKTYFNFITKSGETAETLSQFLVVYDLLKRALGKKKAKEHVIVTTTMESGSLYDVAVKEGFKIFGIPKDVGGRFSVLSAVGLVPLSIVGLDITMLLKGGAEMDEACNREDIFKNPALMAAYMHVKSMRAGKNISVIMPYADSLKFMADFYAQLWGESLGKAMDLDGNRVNVGQTPVKALGVTDQHSQLQLYTEGPFDKIVTFLAVEEFRDGVIIPDDTGISDFVYLKGHTFTQLMEAERKATACALAKAGRANYTVTLPCVCEYTVGALLTYFMYQTAFAGAMLNVNTYDQPGVEEGKRSAYAILGRNGYENSCMDLTRFGDDFIIDE
ncbi:MAG: glucose-6-phosphate isomerase [Firmicutes bacterium]|nr:glucose-6-phosphate isomerase [Bacillota bacterium]